MKNSSNKKNRRCTKRRNTPGKKKITKERKEYFENKRREIAVTRNNPIISSSPKIITRKETNEEMPLNKYLAHSGICSRRDAAELVKAGKVKVNGALVTEPGRKVTTKDEVQFNGKKIQPSKALVYILINKPKDYITTTDDPQNRKTVLDLVKHATKERVYPVGRLDRNTSGVLLLTNDGELSQKLTHPSNEIKKYMP